LDANKDGFVTKEEFCVEMADLKLPGIDKEEFSEIYDAIDVNRDGQLSVNEFGLYVKGAKAPRTERLLNLTE
jgi:Ca2+-binding EF-hand superfamily protein